MSQPPPPLSAGITADARGHLDSIVLRASPDWLSFDPESSRDFCVHHELPADTVVDFVKLWDARLSVPYREFRQALKELSLACCRRVRGARIISKGEFSNEGSGASAADEDLYVFIDDDDWLSPALFESLRQPEAAEGVTDDGALWGSVFLGQVVADTPMEKAGGPVLAKRARSDNVYTNNYAATGHALKRLGAEELFEHAPAHHALHGGRWFPGRSGAYLSVANKHPACTVLAHYNMRSERFRSDPRGVVQHYARDLADAAPDPDIAWMLEPLEVLTRLIEDACR